MADLADGNMQPNPTNARYGFGVAAYTCFQIIHAPKPRSRTSRMLWRISDSHLASFLITSWLVSTYRRSERMAQLASTPVSYTHLRTHETRHDLVCRLLLEKKKKNKK